MQPNYNMGTVRIPPPPKPKQSIQQFNQTMVGRQPGYIQPGNSTLLASGMRTGNDEQNAFKTFETNRLTPGFNHIKSYDTANLNNDLSKLGNEYTNTTDQLGTKAIKDQREFDTGESNSGSWASGARTDREQTLQNETRQGYDSAYNNYTGNLNPLLTRQSEQYGVGSAPNVGVNKYNPYMQSGAAVQNTPTGTTTTPNTGNALPNDIGSKNQSQLDNIKYAVGQDIDANNYNPYKGLSY